MENVSDSTYSEIIKRLELIKSLISLGEEDEIPAHVSKLECFDKHTSLQSIIVLLKEKFYSRAIIEIQKFIDQPNNLTLYIDPEIAALKVEIKNLEHELNLLSSNKADLEKLIHEFSIRHTKELGELILKILYFRKQRFEGTSHESSTAEEYDNYNQEYDVTKVEETCNLTESDMLDLKKKYRQASKLCHPDVVSENQKELADKLFTELNIAYSQNDLKKVSEILSNLENGDYFLSKSDTISEKVLLKTEIEKMRLKVNELKVQYQAILKSESYKTIINIGNWDDYFQISRSKLVDQIKELESVKL